MNIDGITEFMEVSRTLSFTKAAQNLGVSVAHVSRRIAALETRIGGRLLNRSTRSVTPTQLGEEFLLGCNQIGSAVGEAFDRVSHRQTDLVGRIRVASMPGTFAEKVVLPALTAFANTHPDINIDVDLSPGFVDLKEDSFDFAVRSGPTSGDALIRVPLAKRARIAAASPTYLAENGVPATPHDLNNHMCLVGDRLDWQFNVSGKMRRVDVSGRFRCNSGPAILQACLEGLGVAYMALAAYGENLSNGTLTPILSPYWGSEQTIYLLADERRYRPQRVVLAIQEIERRSKVFERAEKQQLEILA